MNATILAIEIRAEADIVLARQRAKQIAQLLGFGLSDQTRIATATSEIVRNAYQHAGGGRVRFALEGERSSSLVMHVVDRGPGIADVPGVLEGRPGASKVGGKGLVSASRLMDRLRIESAPGHGTTVELAKALPPDAPQPTQSLISRIAQELFRRAPGALEATLQQNQELLRVLAESKQAEEALRASETIQKRLVEDLQRTVRLNEMFAGVLGHDLRNPLNGILHAAHLLEQVGPSDRLRRPAQRIIASGERMARLIEQLLDFTRVRTGGDIPVVRRPVDLAELFRHVISELEGASPGRSIDLEIEGSARGKWDADRLAQVFSNLIGNAIEHGRCDEAPVKVRIDARGANEVSIAVTNSGAIPAGALPNIFDAFRSFQLKRKSAPGLGLGLYIAREIVIAHGGTIDAHSPEVGGTTTFTVRLTRSAPIEGDESCGSSRAVPVNRSDKTILVVDDDMDARNAVADILHRLGYRILVASNGREALNLLQHGGHRPALILLDMIMPLMDGIAFRREQAKDPALDAIPVIFISGHGEVAQAAASLHAAGHVLKPITDADILHAVDRVVPPT